VGQPPVTESLVLRPYLRGSIVPEIPPVQAQPVSVLCRFAMTAADSSSSHEFCVFDFPGCKGCSNAMPFLKTVGSLEDPMKSMVWSGWIAGASVPKRNFVHNQGGLLMEEFIHQQNLALFKKRLAGPHTDAQGEVLVKLLTDEQARHPPPTQVVSIYIKQQPTS
jgi:hypothetical protein